MSDYEIGRDLQELRSRVEIVEAAFGIRQGPTRMRGTGRVEGHRTAAGVESKMKPIIWKSAKNVQAPPFLNALLGLPHNLNLDSAQSQSWGCFPEPLIQNVNWSDGTSEECYRLQNQLFTIYRATDPNSGITTCSANYTATLLASGRAKAHEPYSGQLYFNIRLVNAQGGLLQYVTTYPGNSYIVDCHDNYFFSKGGAFNPGLYDIVAGATWEISGFESMDHC